MAADQETKTVDALPGCWDLFTDEALIELLADASCELGRRGKDILVGSSKRVTA